ncbi:MAG: hypothetical protein JXA30_14655 [Deltaproteobacteria bacterium]|nr:hypothetical protein [Deltaproteobacteria bacterium]
MAHTIRRHFEFFLLVSASFFLFACSDDEYNNENIAGSQASSGSGVVETGGVSGSATAGSGGNATAGSGGSAPVVVDSGSQFDGGGGTTKPTTGGSGGSSTGGTPAVDTGVPVADTGIVDAGSVDTGETCDIVIPPSQDCSARLAPGDERTCTIGNREYIVHAGKSMNPCKPVALIIDAHGASENMRQQRGIEEFCAGALCWHGLGSGLAAESDTPGGGFIAVFPQGLSNVWRTTNNDPEFMLDIVDEMKQLADIDPDKIYMMGISNGAMITYQTGCPHSDVFRGLSPNAGGTNCSSIVRPIPVIAFDAEPDFAYAGSVGARDTMVRLNNCQGAPKVWVTVDANYDEAVCRSAKQDINAQLIPCNEVTSAAIEPTVCTEWDQCDEGVKVVFCEVAPNTEHGAANAATDAHIIYENNTILNTPSLAWRFFKQFWKN